MYYKSRFIVSLHAIARKNRCKNQANSDRKKITQESVAYSANVDRTYMNHVENGRRNVTLETLEKIVCEGLETSIRDFFNSIEFEKK